MHESKRQEEELLKELLQEVRNLNEKIDKLDARISRGVVLKERRKDKIRKQVEKSSAFTYAAGALEMAIGAFVLGFSETIARSFYYFGRMEQFALYWSGGGLIVVGGLFTTLSGYIQGRFAEEKGISKKISIFGYEDEIIFNWKRDMLGIISTIVAILGIALVIVSLI